MFQLTAHQSTLGSSSTFIGLVSTASIHGKVDIVSSPTLFAVTNSTTGNVTLNPGPNFIGLVSTASIHGKVELVSVPTLFAVVNTGAAGIQNSLVTLLSSDQFIGLVSTASVHAKAELVTGNAWIGLATVNIGNVVSTSFSNITLSSNVTLNPSDAFIGLATVVVGNNPTFNGNVSLNPSSAFIGLVSTASIHGKVEAYPGASATVPGTSPYFSNSGNATVSEIKATSGRLYGLECSNPTALDAYIQFFDSYISLTSIGVETPKQSFLIPAGDGTKDGAMDKVWTVPISFATAIVYACTQGVITASGPSVAIVVNALYL